MIKDKDSKIVQKRAIKSDDDQLARMSEVTENSVFTHISGVPEYRIGAFDILEIMSRNGDKATATSITVNSRGTISYSFIDDLPVSGLTPSQLDKLLTTRLLNFIKKPRIDILVKGYKSKSATIIGEFALLRGGTGTRAESGRLFLEGRNTLMDLLALAGGFTEDADIRHMKIVRRAKAYSINLFDILEGGDETKNIIIDDGDVINLPKLPEFGERVYVMGAV